MRRFCEVLGCFCVVFNDSRKEFKKNIPVALGEHATRAVHV